MIRNFVVPILVSLVIITTAHFLKDGTVTHSNEPKSTLADRVNAACGPGWTITDWTTGDEYTPVPAGTVKVTCAQVKSPYALKYVAVTR